MPRRIRRSIWRRCFARRPSCFNDNQRVTMTAGTEPAWVTKSADISMALEEFMYSFEAFKDANDQRLKEIGRRSAADPLTVEKVDLISDALHAQKRLLAWVVLNNVRPALGVHGDNSGQALERKQAF